MRRYLLLCTRPVFLFFPGLSEGFPMVIVEASFLRFTGCCLPGRRNTRNHNGLELNGYLVEAKDAGALAVEDTGTGCRMNTCGKKYRIPTRSSSKNIPGSMLSSGWKKSTNCQLLLTVYELTGSS